MNIFQLQKIALQKALKKTDPRSQFAHMHKLDQLELVKDAYKPSMSDDQLYKAITQRVIENKNNKASEYDRLIEPNKALEAEADKILAANPEKFTGDTEDIFNIDELDYMYSDNDELLQNLIAERLNNQKARDFDKRYRTEYAKWEQRQYQPTKGPVYHIRNKNYIPREREGTITPFNDLIENAEAPYAGGVELPSDVGSGVTPDKYREFLDYIRTIK